MRRLSLFLAVLPLLALWPRAAVATTPTLIEVIKVEGPGGDYVRKMAFPIIDGISLLHWHLNRGKRSVVLDLKTPEGVATYLDLHGQELEHVELAPGQRQQSRGRARVKDLPLLHRDLSLRIAHVMADDPAFEHPVRRVVA